MWVPVALLVGCGPVDGSSGEVTVGSGPVSPEGGSTGDGSGAESTAGDADTFEPLPDEGTQDETGEEAPPPPDCEDLSVGALSFSATITGLGEARGLVADPWGGLDVLFGERVLHYDAGVEQDEVEVEDELHPTVIAGDGAGTLFVAGYRDVDLEGELNGFLRRYETGELVAHVDLAHEADANEIPVLLAASSGYVGVVTSVEFDALSPGEMDFARLDRFDPDLLAVVDTMPLDPEPEAIAIDGDGTAYLAIGSSVSALELGGVVRWTRVSHEMGEAPALSVGGESVWRTLRSDHSWGGGELAAYAREDGSTRARVDLPTGSLDELIETPTAVAAQPCGGAVLLAESALGGEDSASLSYVDGDGVRDPRTPLDVEIDSGGWGLPFFGLSIADSGAGVGLIPRRSNDPSYLLVGF